MARRLSALGRAWLSTLRTFFFNALSVLSVLILGAPVFAAPLDQPRLIVSIGHTSRVNALAYSGDGRLVATGGDDGVTSVVDIATGGEMLRHTSHGSIHYLAFAPDNAAIFVGGEDGATLLEFPSARVIGSFPGRFEVSHGGYDGAFAFSSGGRRAFTVNDEFDGVVWDVPAQDVIRRIPSEKDHITAAAFSPDESTLLLSHASGALELIDLSDGQERWRVSESDLGAYSVAFASTGKRVIVGSLKPSVRDTASGRLVRRLEADDLLVLSVALSTNGDYALCGTWGKSAWLWDVRTGAKLLQLPHDETVSAVAFADTDKKLVTGSWDGNLRFWDASSGHPLPGLQASINNVHEVGFRSNLPYIVSSSADNIGFYWDAAVPAMKRFIGHRDAITSASLAPDGERLVTGGGDHTASVWSLATSSEMVRLGPHEQYVIDPQFSADGRLVATAGGRAYFWDALTGESKGRLGEGDLMSAIFRVRLSADGKRLASSGVPGISKTPAITIWNRITGEKIVALPGEMSAWDYRPATHDLAVALEDGTLEIADNDKGVVRKIFGHQQTKVSALSFSADGSVLVAGDAAGSVKIWDAESATILQSLQLPAAISSVAISPDHHTVLATTSPDNLVHVLDLDGDARDIARIATFRDGTWVVVDPNGRFDTNNLVNVRGLAWVLPQKPTAALPVEDFMREYYEPQLLQRLLAHEPLPPVGSLTEIDLRQPEVTIARVLPQPGDREQVSVEIETRNAQEVGAHNLRLFRDGVLVASAPGAISPSLTLGPIALPHQRPSGAVVFSAYAFNKDNVKSVTATAPPYHLAENLPRRKARFYLISIGVSANEHDAWRLSYADNDADLMKRALANQLGGRADETFVPVTLTSKAATTANVQAVLAALSGARYDAARLSQLPGGAALDQAQPEDSVVLFFSGHGYTGANGTFFLVPYDTGTSPISDQSTYLRFISSDQLSNWLARVDASSITLIVDACESAEAVQAHGFRPGPFGSRGLGQLAYDKGMRVLAASEADSVALEFDQLQHGILTYALAEDGLAQSEADRNPSDGTISLSKLLRYGVSRVPELEQEIQDGSVQIAPKKRKDVSLIASLSGAEQVHMQRPVLFDFASDGADVPLVGNSPVIPVAEFSAYAAPPDEDREQDVYESAQAMDNNARKIVALQEFLLRYPLSKFQTPARVRLLETLIATKAAPNEILGTAKSLLASLRDSSDEALALRYTVMVATARAIETDRPSLEAARELLYEALKTTSRSKADPNSDVEVLYRRVLQQLALKGRAEQFSLDVATRKALSLEVQLDATQPSILLYGPIRDALGAGIADAFDAERVAHVLPNSIEWLRFIPPSDEASIRLGESLKVSDTPTILVLDRFDVVRFRDETYSADLGSIIQLQVDTLLKETKHVGAP